MSKPKRIQRRRIKGWRMPAGAVSVTRPGKWGNPFHTAGAFETWLRLGRVTEGELRGYWKPYERSSVPILAARRAQLLRDLHELRGKDLACFCPLDKPCHADVLLELANQG